MSAPPVKSNTRQELRLHPLPVRVMHWTNAVAIFIMIGSGWKIYNDDVIFGFLHFPDAYHDENRHRIGPMHDAQRQRMQAVRVVRVVRYGRCC